MPNLEEVRRSTWSYFLESTPLRMARFQVGVREARARAKIEWEIPGGEVIAATSPEAAPFDLGEAFGPLIEHFSAFDPAHLDRALALSARMMDAAGRSATPDAVARAQGVLFEARGTENPDLLDHAFMVFITHHPAGRLVVHDIPRITLRNPERAASSRAFDVLSSSEPLGEAALAGLGAFSGGVLPSPDGLEWFREDPFANEHHRHWHVVYPSRGVPTPGVLPEDWPAKDRQGEIFFYMHAQMLARYDAERRALGLPPVESFLGDGTPIPDGYSPGPYLRLFGDRQPGAAITNSVGITYLSTWSGILDQAIATGQFLTNPATVVTSDNLGATAEANQGSVLADTKAAGGLHNVGHGVIAALSDGAPDSPGVMTTPETAIRDPIFFCWHRYIDDFYARWQESLGPRSLDDRPLVRVRKSWNGTNAASPDIMIAFEDQLPADAIANLDGWAAVTFGDARWDDDFAGVAPTTSALETWMLNRLLALDDRRRVTPLSHLVHRPFVYFFRLENLVARAYQVTLRVFMVSVDAAEDRRAWIEMDKFVVRLGANEKKVVSRRGSQSSVVRKPAVMVPEVLKAGTLDITQDALDEIAAENVEASLLSALQTLLGRVIRIKQLEWVAFRRELRSLVGPQNVGIATALLFRHALVPSEQPALPPDGTEAEIETAMEFAYCTCGWPYNLLLPRGTTAGAGYRLAVVATDWAIDQVGDHDGCGSLSFCGAVDRYPDIRDMGYPFDRPFSPSIADVIMANDNMAFRDLAIRRLDDVDE